MTVTATYTDASAKVTVACASAPSHASQVTFERSTDGVTWTTVRGAANVTLASGAASMDDYEYADGVVNTYRATYLDTTTPAPVGSPAAATAVTSAGASASATPTMPTGLTTGDVVFVALASTKSTATMPAAPTGWTVLGRAAPDTPTLYCTPWTASLTVPAFTVTGLASGDIVVGKAFAMRNVSSLLGNAQAAVNTASANIAFPAFTSVGGAVGGPLLAFIRSTNTSVSPAATYNDHATGWSMLIYSIVPATYVAGTVTVTGGSSATSAVVQASMQAQPYVSRETVTVTPAMTQVWIKNPLKPYLNRAVIVIGIDDITNPARSATFDVIGRTMPIAVTDLYTGRRTSLTLRTPTQASVDDLRTCLMSGDVQFVQPPKGTRTPTGYFVLGDLAMSAPSNTGKSRYLKHSMVEVAAPSPTLAAIIGTWQTVINDYATWNDLIAAKPTWQDVLLLVGSPTDVVTP